MTAGEVETFVRMRLVALQPPISGGVYYKGMRPRQNDGDEGLEDAEILVPSGGGSELLEGSCIVNIYVPNVLTASGLSLRNKRRTDVLEQWLDGLPAKLRDGKIYFKRDGLIVTMEENDTKEHFVSLKMKFKVLTENY